MNYRFKQPFLRARNLFRYVPYHVRHTAMPVSKCPRPSPKSLSVFLLFICLGHALFSHTGRAVITLEIALPIAATASEERVSIPSTFSGVTRVTLEIPRSGVDLSLNGGLLSETHELKTGGKWTAYGKGAEPIVFAWRRKTEEHHATLPLRMHGTLTQFVGLGEDSTSLSANIT